MASPSTTASSREVARSAVRAHLSAVALRVFAERGYDQVSVADVAAAAGVSRSTFLRHFASKEEAVLSGLTHSPDLVETLHGRPAAESEWTALRRTLDVLVERYTADVGASRTQSKIVAAHPHLRARMFLQHSEWAGQFAEVLLERAGGGDGRRAAVVAGAAMACLSVAVDRWAGPEEDVDLAAEIDAAFAVLAPAPR